MASSRVIASNSTANSDLARQPPLYTLPPVGAAGGGGGGGGGVLHHQGKSLGSMNMDELLRNIYGENSDAEISPFDGEAGGDFQEDGVGGGDGQVECVETKLADEVWKEIARDRKMDGSVGGPEMTLEDYLARAGVVGQDEVGAVPAMVPQPPVEGLVMDNFLRDPFAQSQPPQQQPDSSFLGFGNGVEGGGRGKRRAVQEPADKIAQQRQRRMIKNRESAARSRERKQAYTVELESLVTQLEEENSRLKRQQEEQKKERLKQIMESRVPVTERKLSPRRLRRTLSMQW